MQANRPPTSRKQHCTKHTVFHQPLSLARCQVKKSASAFRLRFDACVRERHHVMCIVASRPTACMHARNWRPARRAEGLPKTSQQGLEQQLNPNSLGLQDLLKHSYVELVARSFIKSSSMVRAKSTCFTAWLAGLQASHRVSHELRQ